MAYEIPQELKYEERIIFGLTLQQFAALAVAGLVGAFVFFRTPLILPLRITVVFVLAFFGLGFAFFDFKGKLANLFNFFGKTRNSGYLDEKTKKFVAVKDVKNNMLFLKDGTARALVQVKPINFGIKSQTEQEAIIQNFQMFLNSLTFPLQILMRTVNLDLDDYLLNLDNTVSKSIEKSGNKSLSNLFIDYKHFMEKFIEENAIQDRLFYLVVPIAIENVPKNERMEAFEKEFDIRVTPLIEKLNAVGLETKVLKTNQLISLLASFFTGFIEVENDYLFPVTILDKYKEAEPFG